jgi:putative salt-induced outer membrane protein
MIFKIAALFLIAFSAHAQFSNESELGLASATGNTRTRTYNFKQSNDYKWDRHVVALRSRYLNSFAQGSETARYFLLNLKYENRIASRFSLFVGESLEKDRFVNIDQRLITDFGGKYSLIDSSKTTLFSELGYRYLHEDRIDSSRSFSNYGRLYTEWSNNWNESFSTKYWLEYLPNFTNETDWLLNTELSLSSMLNSVFALKVGVLIRYDHMPAPGVESKTDTLFTTTLVAKF